MLYEKMTDSRTACRLCGHRCIVKPGGRGVCGVRENRSGTLYSLVYGLVIAEQIDPIEKKPLFHLYPGSRSYSIATAGCNLSCTFCQNHEISQLPRDSGEVFGRPTAAAEIVTRAADSGSRTIAYTYTEPTVYFEYAYDIAVLAKERGIGNIFVTNGFMTEEALAVIGPLLDGANVDLKSFSDIFYRTHCGARLGPVLDAIRTMKERGIWVEVTTLLIPGLNDSDEELEGIAQFIATLGRETPWHISRFYPLYRMEEKPVTPAATIHRAVRIGKASGLHHVYSGNMAGDEDEHTFCASCGVKLIHRSGFRIGKMALDGDRCLHCGGILAGRFLGACEAP